MSSDRIKLAEAMGWHHAKDGHWWTPGGRLAGLPDPFSDANDDCAVLDWMREYFEDDYHASEALRGVRLHRGGSELWYQIGDYARAALKVID